MGAYFDAFCIINIVGGVFVNSTFVFSSKKGGN